MADTDQPAEPAPRLLRRLMAERGFSNRKLARATKELNGRGLTAGHVGNIARGDDQPSAEALQLLARALGVEPDAFLEYRLAAIRRLFDERQIGLDRAAEHLEEFTAGRWEALAESERELQRASTDGSPSESASRETPTRATRSPRRRA